MKVAAENNSGVWICLLLLTLFSCTALPARAAPAPAVPRNLLAHGGVAPYGGEELFWVAQVVPDKEPGSPPGNLTKFFALRASETKWQQWGDGVQMRAVSLASRGSQLAVLLEDGSWVLLSDDNSISTGQRLAVPGAALVTFADDGRTLWALAKIPGGVARLDGLPPSTETSVGTTTPSAGRATAEGLTTSASSTHPTALPAVATHLATSASAVPASTSSISPQPELQFGLVRFGADGWMGEAEITADIARPGDAVSLALIDGEPYLATSGPTGPVRIYRLADSHHAATIPTTNTSGPWVPVCQIDPPADAQDFQLLNGTPVPTLWVRGRTGPDLLYVCKLNAAGSSTLAPAPVLLESSRNAPPDLRAAAYALGLVRSLYVRDGEMYEQSYDRLTGAPVGVASPLALPSSAAIPLTLWRYAAVTVAMLFAIGASFRRREQLRALKVDPATLPLAPLGPRLVAGAIDALPVIAAWFFYYRRMGPYELFGAIAGGTGVAEPVVEVVLWASFAIYLVHTTVGEVFFGRTLGKVILGLRVTGLDGKPPTKGQMVTRNLLRLIDAGLIFLPVLLVPFSPLRQRAGDTAAGTVVLTATPQASEDDPAGPSTGSGQGPSAGSGQGPSTGSGQGPSTGSGEGPTTGSGQGPVSPP